MFPHSKKSQELLVNIQLFHNLANIYFWAWPVFAVSYFTCVLHYRWQTKDRRMCVGHAGGFSKNRSRWSCFNSPPAEKRCGHFKNINEVMQQTEFLGCFTADCPRSATYTLCWAQGKKGRLLLLQIPFGLCTFVNTKNKTVNAPYSIITVVKCKNANA